MSTLVITIGRNVGRENDTYHEGTELPSHEWEAFKDAVRAYVQQYSSYATELAKFIANPKDNYPPFVQGFASVGGSNHYQGEIEEGYALIASLDEINIEKIREELKKVAKHFHQDSIGVVFNSEGTEFIG